MLCHFLSRRWCWSWPGSTSRWTRWTPARTSAASFWKATSLTRTRPWCVFFFLLLLLLHLILTRFSPLHPPVLRWWLTSCSGSRTTNRPSSTFSSSWSENQVMLCVFWLCLCVRLRSHQNTITCHATRLCKKCRADEQTRKLELQSDNWILHTTRYS